MFCKRLVTAMGLALLGGSLMVVGTGSPPAGAATNAPGVTAKTVTVGQVDDLSAPLPGLFKSAEDGTKAYFDYINSKGGVNGRKLVLDARDSAFNAGTVVAETKAQVKSDFALVGGFSLLDQAEAPIISHAAMPDVAYPLSSVLANDPHVYSPSPAASNAWPTGALKYFKKKYPQAVKHVGMLFGTDTPTEIAIQHSVVQALNSQGYKIVYQHGISALTTDFLPDVLKMKAEGVQMLYEAELPTQEAADLAKVLAQENMKVVNVEIAAYAANLGQLAGSAGNGMYFAQLYSLYQGEDAKAVPAVATFDHWVTKVDPKVFDSTEPVSALYGWTSAQLFVQALKASGPNPTRAALLDHLNKVTSFTGSKILAPGNPAKNIPPSCWLLAQLENGKIKRVSPTPKSGYVCNPGGNHPKAGWKPQHR